MFKTWLVSEEKNNALDSVQAALDVIGFEPTVGSLADTTNSLISLMRAALSKESDQRKKHLINAGISAVSMLPFADVAKLFKYRPARKAAVAGARSLQGYAQQQKAAGRF